MFKYTANTLKKIEGILSEAGYIVRYEKGTFNPGYCILKDKKVIVVNKYFDTESRINTLLDILPQIEVNEEALSEDSKAFLDKNLQKT